MDVKNKTEALAVQLIHTCLCKAKIAVVKIHNTI